MAVNSQDFDRKIKTITELSDIAQDLKKAGKKIVLCHGVFDLLHVGHLRHFMAAKEQGDVLFVTITKDEYVGKGPGRPVFNQRLRSEFVAALQCVDYVAVNEWRTATETIKTLKPDVYVKGSDYSNRTEDLTGEIYKEEEAAVAVGARVHFTDEVTFSSSSLLNAYFDVYPEGAQAFLQEFRERYSADDVVKSLKELKGLKVLVVGDTIVDEYHYCRVLGKSTKDVILTAKYLEEEAFAGGALAAANHVAGFCEHVSLFSCVGADDYKGEFIRQHLKPNVQARFLRRVDAPTVVKRRFVEQAFLRKLFEVCFLEDRPLPEQVDKEACRYLKENIRNFDVVLVTDFGHGFIGRNIVDVLCSEAKFLALNTQTNSANAGFNLVTKYPRADYVCIDEPEIRLASHSKFGAMQDMMRDIAVGLSSARMAVTRGHVGSVTYAPQEGFFETPVFSNQVIDTTGAGDAYLSVTAPCVAKGYPMDLVGFIGNVVGALAVRIVGNRTPVEPVPLFKFITALLK